MLDSENYCCNVNNLSRLSKWKAACGRLGRPLWLGHSCVGPLTTAVRPVRLAALSNTPRVCVAFLDGHYRSGSHAVPPSERRQLIDTCNVLNTPSYVWPSRTATLLSVLACHILYLGHDASVRPRRPIILCIAAYIS